MPYKCSRLMFAVQANGAEVTIIEGLAKGEKLHPLRHIAQAIKAATSGWPREVSKA